MSPFKGNFTQTKKPRALILFKVRGFCNFKPGLVLLSHTVAHAVPSALRDLTSVFGMGTGVALSLTRPGKFPCVCIRLFAVSCICCALIY